jgi:hypothetical protein
LFHAVSAHLLWRFFFFVFLLLISVFFCLNFSIVLLAFEEIVKLVELFPPLLDAKFNIPRVHPFFVLHFQLVL